MLSIDGLAGGENPLARAVPGNRLDEGRLPQRKAQPSQEMKVRADRGTDDRKQRVDRLAVERPELDRPVRESRASPSAAGCASRSDCGRAARRCRCPAPSSPAIPGPSSTWSKNWRSTCSGRGITSTSDWSTESLSVAAEPVVDAAGLEGLGQAHGRAAAVRLDEDVGRDVQPLRSRPFEQFRPIEAILLVDPVGRQLALFHPAVDRLLGNFQQLSGITDTQIHPSCSVAAVLSVGQ